MKYKVNFSRTFLKKLKFKMNKKKNLLYTFFVFKRENIYKKR